MTSYHCPLCGHAVENRTVHRCPPAEMTYRQALEEVISAALGASEGQCANTEELDTAIAVLRKRNP